VNAIVVQKRAHCVDSLMMYCTDTNSGSQKGAGTNTWQRYMRLQNG